MLLILIHSTRVVASSLRLSLLNKGLFIRQTLLQLKKLLVLLEYQRSSGINVLQNFPVLIFIITLKKVLLTHGSTFGFLIILPIVFLFIFIKGVKFLHYSLLFIIDGVSGQGGIRFQCGVADPFVEVAGGLVVVEALKGVA